jgi:hypothetical protein
VQEAPLADPAAPLDELGVHDRDLPGRPAEADEAELQPEAQREGRAGGRSAGERAVTAAVRTKFRDAAA